MCEVSVIVPSYKPGAYLWKCLDSLQTQTLPKDAFEVILVLNGCKEPYENEIRKYLASSALNCNFIQVDEGGVSNARNTGIDAATGEYIAFIDDDDYVSPSYIEELYNKASEDTVSLAYPFAFSDGDDGIQLENRITEEYDNKYTPEKLQFQEARRYFSGPCMKLIHRNMICERRFDKRLKNGEDTLFMFQISNKIKYVSFTSPNAKYYRRFRQNSATTTKRNVSQKIRQNIVGLSAYFSIYFRNIKQYNFLFFITRVLGAIRGMVA